MITNTDQVINRIQVLHLCFLHDGAAISQYTEKGLANTPASNVARSLYFYSFN